MSRIIVEEAKIHPSIRETVANSNTAIVKEVKSAIASNDVVVIGMRQNPFPRRACKTLDATGVKYKYMEYGSYFSAWRPRLALKMWTGWPTLPMIFVKGVLIGGSSDLDKLIKSGELSKMLS